MCDQKQGYLYTTIGMASRKGREEKHGDDTTDYTTAFRDSHKEEIIERRKRRQQEIRDWFRRYKSTLYCMDCGISHPAVLQFHHRDRAGKSFNIANVASRATSIKQITNEMKKCDVVCVNCHAKRHWRETHETNNWDEVLPPEE